MELHQFKKQPIIGILRGIQSAHVEPLVETVVSSGLKTIEITLNTPNACDLIQNAVKTARGRLTIGAGTVLDVPSLKNALAAGATFIVMPVLVRDVVDYCVQNQIPVFPGAFTPQEIYTAWNAGATMVKVFPAKFFGPEYLKEIKGPFETIELLACGGVTSKNISEFFSCGASAVSFGASIFKPEWFQSNDFEKMELEIRKFVDSSPRFK